MHGVSKRIEDGGNFTGDGWRVAPDIPYRQRDEFGKGSCTVYANALRVRAEMPPTRKAVPAATADHVALSTHEVPDREVRRVRAQRDDFADEFMPDHEGHGNGALGPFIPQIDVQVGPAQTGLQDLDQNVACPDLGDGNFLKPQPPLFLAFNESLQFRVPPSAAKPRAQFSKRRKASATRPGKKSEIRGRDRTTL